MTTGGYTPALGHASLSGFYDLAIALWTRERRWRSALLDQIAPQGSEVVIDVGCGTGALTALIKARAPGAAVTGIDPDPDILARAQAKAAAQGLSIAFSRGFADDAAALVGRGKADKAVSSLVFHQVPLAGKRSGLAAMFDALRPGGELHIADYGLQRTPLMRLLFRQVQALDGRQNTQPSADGVLPDLMVEVGFEAVEERTVLPTPSGSISFYRARKPKTPADD
jgi:trans-aconitate methyltransferase